MHKITILVCVFCLLVGLVPAATAAEPGEIMMGGFLLWRIRCESPGYTLAERAEIIQARVNNLLELGAFDPSSLRIVSKGNDVSIYAGSSLLITLNDCDARANRTTQMGLAQVWVQRLREIFPQAAPKPPPAIMQPAG